LLNEEDNECKFIFGTTVGVCLNKVPVDENTWKKNLLRNKHGKLFCFVKEFPRKKISKTD